MNGVEVWGQKFEKSGDRRGYPLSTIQLRTSTTFARLRSFGPDGRFGRFRDSTYPRETPQGALFAILRLLSRRAEYPCFQRRRDEKCALLRRRPISGFIAVRAPARFARNSIPRTPVTARPVLEASWRPSCSSMSTISALSSVAKAMAPAAHLSQWSTGQRFAKREPLPYEAAFLAGKGFSS
jgi:hypothetical protein